MQNLSAKIFFLCFGVAIMDFLISLKCHVLLFVQRTMLLNIVTTCQIFIKCRDESYPALHHMTQNNPQNKLQVPEKPQNFCKIQQRNIFLAQSGSKLPTPPGPRQRVIRNFYIAYKRTIHLYFLNAKFHPLRDCFSRLYIEEITIFWFRTQLGPFLEAWGQ